MNSKPLALDAIIGPGPVPTVATFEVFNPSTGEVLAEVARGGKGEIDEAVAAAREAHEGVWRRSLPSQRATLLHALAGLIRRDHGKLAELESLDTGKPLRQAGTDAAVAARYFEFYANTIEALYGSTIPALENGFAYTTHEPWGVCGHIVPWNYPLQISCRSIAPALATGNCCVLKPAEEAPLTAILLAELALEAGLPPGVLNVVPGLGEEAGAALASHPGIDFLSFTGSPEVGAIVTKAAADNSVPVALELGGKSPNIVFADADLEVATPTIVNSILQNAGQTCAAGSRLLVAAEIQDEVVNELCARFGKVKIGAGIDDPDLGPIISKQQLERVSSMIAAGAEEAELLTGGKTPADPGLGSGYFLEPTIFGDVGLDSSVAREEFFGPVLAVSPFDDVEEALAIANGTDYGLIAAVWTKDVSRAHWMARELRTGQVYVNTYGAGGGVELPFGGVRRSGHGREKGFEALLAFTQTKSVAISFG